MNTRGVPVSGAALDRLATLADKAAGYPARSVLLGDGSPSEHWTLRLAEPVETDDGEFYPVPAELEAAMQRGAPTLTAQERAELQAALSQARPIQLSPEAPNDRITPRTR